MSQSVLIRGAAPEDIATIVRFNAALAVESERMVDRDQIGSGPLRAIKDASGGIAYGWLRLEAQVLCLMRLGTWRPSLRLRAVASRLLLGLAVHP